MLKGKFILGMLIGLLADAVMPTFNYIAFKLNLTPIVFWQNIAALFFEKKDLFNAVSILAGGLFDLTVTMFLGIIFIYYINFVGKEHLWIKGIIFGMMAMVILFGLILTQLVKDTIPPEPLVVLLTIFAHFIYGLSLVAFTRLLARDMI